MKSWVARRWLATALALAFVVGTLVPAGAQSSSDTGIVQITVKDAAAQANLADARVFLVGPTVASALTAKSGIVKYTDVPSGLYRVRVSKSGFAGVVSGQFEVLGNKQVDVDVDLGVRQQPSGQQATTTTSDSGLKVIGTVRARVTVTTTDVDENSAVRKISDSLTDALSTIGGVDVTQGSNDPNAPQTISLRGHDESQTAVTLDGIPLSAPGSAADLRKINTDLFSGAGVSFGAQAGSLGGSVNFRTLQPTQTWQTKFATSYGTFDRYSYSIGETGSIGKLGIAVLHTKRAGNSPLTFQDYVDQSGIDYAHGGESANIGDFLKLRYPVNDRTTVMATMLQNNQASSSLCTQDVTPLPCGIGPGNSNSGKFQFGYATVQSLIGDTAVTVTGYVNNNTSFTNDLNRTIFECPQQPPTPGCVSVPISSPFSSTNGSFARGLAASATLTRDKHTFTLTGSTYAGITTFTPLVNPPTLVNGQLVTFSQPSTFATASRTIQFSDQYKVNDKLALGPNISYAGTTGAGSSILAGMSANWRPTAADTYNASISFGSSQPANGLVRSYPDPTSARVNCFAGSAVINAPGDLPSHQSAANYDLSWTHQWSHGQFSLNAYRQTQGGQLVGAQVTAESAGLPGDLMTGVGTYFGNVCGVGTPLSQIYANEQIGGTTRLYQGYTANANLALGKNVVLIPSYTTSTAEVTAANLRYVGLDSTLVLDSQLPGRPVHSANVTLDGLYSPAGLEIVANAHYVGPNNNQFIAPYTLVNVGLSHALGMGRITVFASNLFNTESGNFSTLQYAQPIALSGGGYLLQAARPNAPRSYTVSYSVNTGARPGAGFSRGARGTATTAAAAGTPGQQARGLGFGQLKFIPPPAGVDPLSLATSRPECTADLQPAAQKVLAQIGAAATAFAAGKPLPEVDGLVVTPHGDAAGTWWLGLGPKIPDGVFAARRAAAGGQDGGGPRPPGSPGGPGGEEGGPGGPGGPPPGGFQPRVTVAPRTGGSPRPDFSPPPELIAALAPLRAAASCAYGTTLTPAEAKAKGYDVAVGVNVAGPRPSPGPSAVPAPSTVPGASPAPGASPGPRRGFGSPLNYAPGIGIFVVRAPDLGTGGGSVRQ
jgi:TonB-dependent Receptor Plug Domain